jgi:hypothetical protein
MYTSIWDFFKVEKTTELQPESISDGRSISNILSEQLSTIDPDAMTTVYLITEQVVRDNKILYDPSLDINEAELISCTYPRNLVLLNEDDATAMVSWETIGMEMPSYADKISWSNSSRLLHIGFHSNHIGLSMIDKGKMIDGLSFDRNNVYTSQLRTDSVHFESDYSFYMMMIENFIDKMTREFTPDTISILPQFAPGHEALIERLTRLLSQKSVFFLLKEPLYASPLDWVNAGTCICAQKDLIGSTPIFIRSIQDEDGLIEMKFGG